MSKHGDDNNQINAVKSERTNTWGVLQNVSERACGFYEEGGERDREECGFYH